MEGIDRSLVTEGYPTDEGLHFLWSDHSGWPVINVVRVQRTQNEGVTWWRDVCGTDRPTEVPSLFGFAWDTYLGSSRITPDAVAHYDALWTRTAEAVKAMLVGHGASS